MTTYVIRNKQGALIFKGANYDYAKRKFNKLASNLHLRITVPRRELAYFERIKDGLEHVIEQARYTAVGGPNSDMTLSIKCW